MKFAVFPTEIYVAEALSGMMASITVCKMLQLNFMMQRKGLEFVASSPVESFAWLTVLKEILDGAGGGN
jgi:hypothetical protein